MDDPTGAATGSDRVLRGGCWDGPTWLCRSAGRGNGAPGVGNRVLGPRLPSPGGQGERAEPVRRRWRFFDGYKDAAAFWNRQLELHPDVPVLKAYAIDEMKTDTEVAKWLAQSKSSQTTTSRP